MRWASTATTSARLEDAIDEAAETLIEELGAGGAPDLVLAFVTPHHAAHWGSLSDAVGRHFPDALLLGCSCGGAIGGGRELEQEQALSLTAAVLPGVSLAPFHLDDDQSAWEDSIGVAAEDEPAFLLLPDPFTFDSEELLGYLDEVYPGHVKVGGLASGARGPGGNALFIGERVERAGLVGVALSGDICVDTVVAQGCRPVGAPMWVTRAAGNVALELDGAPAIEALEKLHAQLSPDDRALLRHSLFLGLGMEERREVYRQGDFLVRNLVGVDPGSGAIAVAAPLREGQVVQFHLRDATASSTDLDEMLSRYEHHAPAGGLLFSCLGRGQQLYGHPDHDSKAFARAIGDVPLGGFFCNGEIGPVERRTYVHGYTSSFALFRRRGASA
jgi:small ligand-binding sensory domain FIST